MAKKKTIAAVQLKSVGTTVDDLDMWAASTYAWEKLVYEWCLAVHAHNWPKKLALEVPKPPPPPPYPPKS